MSEIVKGVVSFVNHEKKYILIEYEQNGKKKTVNGSVDEKIQKKLKEEKIIRKVHQFHIGDTVSCKVKLSDRGDKMVATNIQYLYNTALDVLLNKAKTDNDFIGYLKIVDDTYFIKEIDSYLFFPLPLSPWQIKPTEDSLNEAIHFSLENIEKKDKVTAVLTKNLYLPEYHSAVKAFKTETPVDAVVYNITPHGIYLNLFNNKIQAKINTTKTGQAPGHLKIGDALQVRLTYLSPFKIVVEAVV